MKAIRNKSKLPGLAIMTAVIMGLSSCSPRPEAQSEASHSTSAKEAISVKVAGSGAYKLDRTHLIGNWVSEDRELSMRYFENSAVLVTEGASKLKGAYTLLESNTIQMEMIIDGESKRFTAILSSVDELTVKNPTGKTVTLAKETL